MKIQAKYWQQMLDEITDHHAYIHYCCQLYCAGRESCKEDRIIAREIREAQAQILKLKVLLGWDYKSGSYK